MMKQTLGASLLIRFYGFMKQIYTLILFNIIFQLEPYFNTDALKLYHS